MCLRHPKLCALIAAALLPLSAVAAARAAEPAPGTAAAEPAHGSAPAEPAPETGVAEPVPATPAPEARPAAVGVELTLSALAPGRPVPERFLGLSFEAQAIGQIGALADRGDFVTLLRSLGPGVIRFGGITADQNVGWTDPDTPRPAWASSTIGPSDMQALGRLARRSGWKVLLTVGMAHFEPQSAAREVFYAHAALGAHLEAVEIGNEPDAYGRHGFRAMPWITQGYQEQVSVYREAIDALTPGIHIAGPDVSGSGAFTEWGYAEAASQAPVLLTGHHYPLGCASTPPPSIEELLSAASRGREAHSLETYLTVSRNQGIPFRVDEANSVSCGGVAGISDTFASALWAAGYIGQSMAAGTVGINLQGNPTNCAGYTPLCATSPAALTAGEMRAEPDWYALLLTRSLVGYRPLPTSIEAAGETDLAAYGFAGPGRTRKLLLVDDDPPGSPPLAVRAPLGAGFGAAQVMRLTGPAPDATLGTRLAGRAVSSSGRWTPPARETKAPVRGGVLELALEPSSAALVTVAQAPRKHRSREHKRSA